ncbi:MAG: ABC transporter permease [Anaerolineae bacterium]|nr:ABC transporter permease [Anaerolineae bacterium]
MATTTVSLDKSLPRPRRRLPTWVYRLRRSPVGLIGAVIVTVVVVIAILAPTIAPLDPTKLNLGKRLLPPIWITGSDPTFLLGTDQLGRDMLSRLLWGSRISAVVGVAAVALSALIGVTLGLVSGFFGGWVDILISRALDSFMAIPFIVLALAVVSVLGGSLVNIIIVLGFTGWVSFARVVRGEVLTVRERDYVTAARSIGQRNRPILVRHILPNVIGSIIVLATLDVAVAIIAESSLSYLGLGVQPPTVTWGLMLADGRDHLATSWWLSTFPGLAISITVLGIIFLGDWLRDVLDPRLKK